MPSPKTLPEDARGERLAPTAARETPGGDWLTLVAEKVKTLDYGVVQIVVHGGQVVQIERTERHRFKPGAEG